MGRLAVCAEGARRAAPTAPRAATERLSHPVEAIRPDARA